MFFRSVIKFRKDDDDEEYLTINSSYREYAHDVVIESINSLIALLEIGNQKFDDDIIDHLKMRIEELRNK